MIPNTLILCSWGAIFVYALLIDTTFLMLWMFLLFGWILVTNIILKDHKENSKRVTLRIASWTHPYHPTAFNRFEVCVDKAKAYL
jgi:hypothetical protein